MLLINFCRTEPGCPIKRKRLVEGDLHGRYVAGDTVGTLGLYAGDEEALAHSQALELLDLACRKVASVGILRYGVAHRESKNTVWKDTT